MIEQALHIPMQLTSAYALPHPRVRWRVDSKKRRLRTKLRTREHYPCSCDLRIACMSSARRRVAEAFCMWPPKWTAVDWALQLAMSHCGLCFFWSAGLCRSLLLKDEQEDAEAEEEGGITDCLHQVIFSPACTYAHNLVLNMYV